MKKQRGLVILLIMILILSNISFAVPVDNTESDYGFYLLGGEHIYRYYAPDPDGGIGPDTLTMLGRSVTPNDDLILDYDGEFFISTYDALLDKTDLVTYDGTPTEISVAGQVKFIFNRRNELFYMSTSGFYKYDEAGSDLLIKSYTSDRVLDVAFNNSCTSLFVLNDKAGQRLLDAFHFDFNMNFVDWESFAPGDYDTMIFAGAKLILMNSMGPVIDGVIKDESMTIIDRFSFPTPEPMLINLFASIGQADVEITDQNFVPIRVLDLHIGEGYDPVERFKLNSKNADGIKANVEWSNYNRDIIEISALDYLTPLTRGTTNIIGSDSQGDDSILVRVTETRTPTFTFLESISQDIEGQMRVTINQGDEYWQADEKLCRVTALKSRKTGDPIVDTLDAKLYVMKDTEFEEITDTASLAAGTYQAKIVAQEEYMLELLSPERNFTLEVVDNSTHVDLGSDVNLNCGFMAANFEYTLSPTVSPEFPLEAYNWHVDDRGVFSFDQETMTITALTEGTGYISLTVDGVTDMVTVNVTEEVPGYTVEDIYLEQNVYAEGHLAFRLHDFNTEAKVELADGSYVDYREYIYDTSTLGDQTIHFRIQGGSLERSATTEGYYDVYQTVEVVKSNLDDVVVVSEEFMTGSHILFYDFVHERFVYAVDFSYLSEGSLSDLNDVAIGMYDQLFILIDHEVYAYDLDSQTYELWTSYQLESNQVLQGFEGLDIDIDGYMYLTYSNNIMKYQMDYENKTLSYLASYEVEAGVSLEDIAIDRLGDLAYLSGVSDNFAGEADFYGGTGYKAIFNLKTEVLDFVAYSPMTGDSYPGLAYTNDSVYAVLRSEGLSFEMYGHDFNTLSENDIDWPIYLYNVTGAASRYPTQISASDISLDVGYGQTTSDGQEQITMTVNPAYRAGYPATYQKINGSGFTVDSSGLVTGTTSGLGQIKITLDGASTIINVTVTNHSAPYRPSSTVRVSVTPDPIELDAGPGAEITSINAQATVSGTSNDSITWTIADTSVATVDEEGLVTAVAEGQTRLTARAYNGASDTVDVFVYFLDEEINPLGLVEFYSPYISGYPDQSFRPGNIVTRAELATMFSRILGLDLNVTGKPFDDIEGHWAENYILSATKAGLFAGYEDGSFKPEQEISRAEIAAVISNYWDYFNVSLSPELVDLKDVSESHWAKNYIYRLYNMGLIKEDPGKTYRPDDGTLREEVVIILNVLIDREPLSKETPTFSDVQSSNPAMADIEAASSTAPIKDK